ncbi:TraM recognition domain-containing protein, partial [Floridanema evergladense]
VLFNPGDYDTAEKYSKRYGEVEVLVKNRSTGSSMGQHTSRSVNWNEQLQKKPLISADEILRFPQGKCIITSPAYSSGTEALFPYPLKVPVKPSDRQRALQSEVLWDSQIRPQLEKRAIGQSLDPKTKQVLNIDEELDCRIRAAEQLLPHPHDPSDPVTTADVQANQTASGAIAVGKIREALKNKAISGVIHD